MASLATYGHCCCLLRVPWSPNLLPFLLLLSSFESPAATWRPRKLLILLGCLRGSWLKKKTKTTKKANLGLISGEDKKVYCHYSCYGALLLLLLFWPVIANHLGKNDFPSRALPISRFIIVKIFKSTLSPFIPFSLKNHFLAPSIPSF